MHDGQSGVAQLGTGWQGFLAQDTFGTAFPSVLGSSSPTFLRGQRGLQTFPWATSSLLGCRGRFDQGTRGSSNGLSSFQDVLQNPGSRPLAITKENSIIHNSYAKGHFLAKWLTSTSPGSSTVRGFLWTNHPEGLAGWRPLHLLPPHPSLKDKNYQRWFCTLLKSGHFKTDDFSRPESLKGHKFTGNKIYTNIYKWFHQHQQLKSK